MDKIIREVDELDAALTEHINEHYYPGLRTNLVPGADGIQDTNGKREPERKPGESSTPRSVRWWEK